MRICLALPESITKDDLGKLARELHVPSVPVSVTVSIFAVSDGQLALSSQKVLGPRQEIEHNEHKA